MNNREKAIYLLPNLITSVSLICGVLSILNSTSGNYFLAGLLIFIGAAIDGLDGTVARITRTSSIFGMNYDSLADLVCFGVAPGILYYSKFSPSNPMDEIVMSASLLYIVCGALRLARYNVTSQDPSKKEIHFVGMPIPIAGGFVASLIIAPQQLFMTPNVLFLTATMTTILCAILMVSTFRYYNLRRAFRRSSQNFELLVLFVIICTLAIFAKAHLFLIIFYIGVIYAISGPLGWVLSQAKGRRDQAQAISENKPEQDNK
jgi:CDP-diacylglycerol---serine O-phosphatidyltransferase